MFAKHENIKTYFILASFSVALFFLPFSIKACHAALLLILAAWIFEGEWSAKWLIIKQSAILQIWLLFFLLHLVGILYTDSFNASVIIIEKKIFLFLIPVAIATQRVRLSKNNIHFLLNVFIASCFTAAVVCIYVALQNRSDVDSFFLNFDALNASSYHKLNDDAANSWSAFSYTGLAKGIQIHPTYLSVYLAFSIAVLLYQISNSTNRLNAVLRYALILFFLIVILLLSSRLAIGVTCIVVINAIYRTTPRSMTIRTILSFLFMSSVLMILYLNPISRYRNFQEIASSDYSLRANNLYYKSAEIRSSLWLMSIASFGNVNPLWGGGLDDPENAIRVTSDKLNIKNVLNTNDPHNQFLYTLLSLGIIGAVVLLLCFGISMYVAVINEDYLTTGFLFIFISLCMTESAFELQKGIDFFCIIFSLLCFQYNRYQSLSFKVILPE